MKFSRSDAAVNTVQKVLDGKSLDMLYCSIVLFCKDLVKLLPDFTISINYPSRKANPYNSSN